MPRVLNLANLYIYLYYKLVSIFYHRETILWHMFLQISTFKNLGLDTPRSFVYGAICSFLAPSGYGRSREPDSQPFGLSLMPNLIAGGNNQGRNATATFNGRYAGHHEVGRYLEIFLNINDTHKLLLV